MIFALLKLQIFWYYQIAQINVAGYHLVLPLLIFPLVYNLKQTTIIRAHCHIRHLVLHHDSVKQSKQR